MRRSLLSAALLVTLSGCGGTEELAVAAAGALGGCALLDTDDDAEISDDEAAIGLFDAFDRDDDRRVTRAEFDTAVARGGVSGQFRGEFDDWDADGSGALDRDEFVDGAAGTDDLVGVADATCDEIGL